MKTIINRYIPFKGYGAINLFGVTFVRKGFDLTDVDINHESIHTAQMRELLYIPFYIIYVVEWLVRLTMRGNAYRNISFEREAYGHERNLNYLQHRKHYAWMHYFKKKKH